MNVAGRAGPFLHPRGHACFGDDRAAAWRQGGPLATALADCPVIAIVGDSAFVHAHLPAGATRDGIERLNGATARSWHPPRSRPGGTPTAPKAQPRLSSGRAQAGPLAPGGDTESREESPRRVGARGQAAAALWCPPPSLPRSSLIICAAFAPSRRDA